MTPIPTTCGRSSRPRPSRTRSLTRNCPSVEHRVIPQPKRQSKVFTADATSRVTFAGAGGSSRSLRHRATTASASRSRDSSTPHSSPVSHSASWAWSSTAHSRNPKHVPDLHPVAADRPTRPVVRGELLRSHLHLLSHVRHRRRRDLLCALREPGLHLEELQQQREPQPVRPGLVPQPLLVVVQQRPDLDQVLRLPVLTHAQSLPDHPNATKVTGPHQRRDENGRSQDNRPPDRLQRATCHFAAASGEQGQVDCVGRTTGVR